MFVKMVIGWKIGMWRQKQNSPTKKHKQIDHFCSQKLKMKHKHNNESRQLSYILAWLRMYFNAYILDKLIYFIFQSWLHRLHVSDVSLLQHTWLEFEMLTSGFCEQWEHVELALCCVPDNSELGISYLKTQTEVGNFRLERSIHHESLALER